MAVDYKEIRVRRDTLANFAAAGYVPDNGEPIGLIGSDGKVTAYLIGDGTSTVGQLPALSKGDQGPRGLQGTPGTNGVATDQAVATNIQTAGSATRSALAQLTRVTTAADFGAVPGMADASTALEAAFAAWMADGTGDQVGRLVVPPGTYYCSRSIVSRPKRNMSGGEIALDGVNLVFASGVDYGLVFDTTVLLKDWAGLRINGGTLTGAGLKLKSNNSPGYLYGVQVNNLKAFGIVGGHGVFIDGAFEIGLNQPMITMGGAATSTFNGIHCQAVDAGDVSSIDIVAPNVRGGLNNIYGSSADVKIWGGSGFQAYHESVYIENSEGNTVDGMHVEKCWLDPSSNTNDGHAGVFISGAGTVKNITAHRSGGNMTTAIRCYSASTIQIIGGGQYDLLSYAFLDGANNSSVVMVGIPEDAIGGSGVGYTISPGYGYDRVARVMKLGGTTREFAFDGSSKKTVGAAATDSQSVITLTNQLRAALVSLGLVS